MVPEAPGRLAGAPRCSKMELFVVDFGGLLSLIPSGRVGNLVMAAGLDLGCGTGVFAPTQIRLWREQREQEMTDA
jgi:hypothetical protein